MKSHLEVYNPADVGYYKQLVASGENFKTADLHHHTRLSDGNFDEELLLVQAHRRGLSAFAITDHDIRSSGRIINKGYQRGYEKEMQLLSGVEVSTQEGHVLAWGIDDEIKPGQSAVETILEIWNKGGEVGIAHPEFETYGIARKNLNEVLQNSDIKEGLKKHSLAIEIYNAGVGATTKMPKGILKWAGLSGIDTNALTREWFNTHKADANLSGVAGSDGHGFLPGSGRFAYEATNVLEAIRQNKTIPLFDRRVHTLAGAIIELVPVKVGSKRQEWRKRSTA